MERVPTIVGWVVGLALFVGLVSLIPPARCRDGWSSPSIGRQGACSHHGGVVGYGGLMFWAAVASFGVGSFTANRVSGIVDRRRNASFKRSLVPPAADAAVERLIFYAILSQSKVEFFYKGQKDLVPKLRIVSPTALRTIGDANGRPGTPAMVGHCHTRQARRTFALDRITRLKLSRP